jgi:hypothetical protein
VRELKEIEAAIHNLNVRVSELESWRDGDYRCQWAKRDMDAALHDFELNKM